MLMKGLLVPERGQRPTMVFLVSRDPRRPGGWRVSRFDEAGPVGHTEAASFEKAVGEAKAQGADIARAMHVDATNVDMAAEAFGLVMQLEEGR
jgi:hypothetical protein